MSIDFTKYDFFIFSSHKTATQTLLATFKINGYNSLHIHTISNFNVVLKLNYTNNELIEYFMKGLAEYKSKNNKKLKIITVIRNPYDRLISSFFQQNYDDMINQYGCIPKNTIIMKHDTNSLKKYFYDQLIADRHNLYNESILEINNLFNIDILNNVVKQDKSYYYSHDLFELYILDFNEIISTNLNIYLSNVLDISIDKIGSSNETSKKIYYEKFKKFKNLVINDKYYIDYVLNKYDNVSNVFLKKN